MAKHPTSSRVHRNEEVPDDAFVSTVKRITRWTQENRTQVTVSAAAILVAAAGAAWFISSQRALEQTAAGRLAQVQQTVASGNAQLAIQDLQNFVNTFGSTSAGDQARLMLADLLIQQDRAQEAVDALGELPNELDNPFGLPGARLHAAALEELGRYDEAANAYQRLAREARFEYQRREALADAARVHLHHGDPAVAVDLYQQVLDTFDEQESGRGYYTMWLAEARAAAQTGQGTTAQPPADGDGTS